MITSSLERNLIVLTPVDTSTGPYVYYNDATSNIHM
nr:MAG TPA: hypothetical protein [Caudoviricetes sp.]